MKITKEALIEILERHQLWLRGEYKGERAILIRADLTGFDLTYANLRGANLTDVNLTEAILRGANLTDVNLNATIGNMNQIKSLFLETYSIVYTDKHLQIGCEKHLIEEWKEFNEEIILSMDGKRALNFWKKYKDFIFKAIELSPSNPTGHEKQGEDDE